MYCKQHDEYVQDGELHVWEMHSFILNSKGETFIFNGAKITTKQIVNEMKEEKETDNKEKNQLKHLH